jgi:hypothetical protein
MLMFLSVPDTDRIVAAKICKYDIGDGKGFAHPWNWEDASLREPRDIFSPEAESGFVPYCLCIINKSLSQRPGQPTIIDSPDFYCGIRRAGYETVNVNA